jgi:hypothetical protein
MPRRRANWRLERELLRRCLSSGSGVCLETVLLIADLNAGGAHLGRAAAAQVNPTR